MQPKRLQVSVIIPTYNRADILRKTLQAYDAQDGYERILEVLVIDDGSKDHTRAIVEESCRRGRVPLRYLYQQNSGLAAARNHAIREARGNLILFGDDDITPGQSMVAEHLAWHEEYPEPTAGVLGHVAWAREVRATPFMEWAGLYGPQFQFGYFKPGMELDFRHAYFCNTSIKSCFLKQNGFFDENFRGYGWEDIEFSYRLYRKGWLIRYNPRAIGYHHKFETFEQSLRRVEQVWRKSWPVYLKTESGKRFSDLMCAERSQSAQKRKSEVRKQLGRLKRITAPLLRPLMDSRLKLPNKVYDFVWHYYSRPIVDAAFRRRETAALASYDIIGDLS
jgi:glycosyltransferase involved in cell wall biosynthesis